MLENRFSDPDAFYQALLDAHAGLSLAESHALNARLVLVLANEVGDMARLRQALAAARVAAPVDMPADMSADLTVDTPGAAAATPTATAVATAVATAAAEGSAP